MKFFQKFAEFLKGSPTITPQGLNMSSTEYTVKIGPDGKLIEPFDGAVLSPEGANFFDYNSKKRQDNFLWNDKGNLRISQGEPWDDCGCIGDLGGGCPGLDKCTVIQEERVNRDGGVWEGCNSLECPYATENFYDPRFMPEPPLVYDRLLSDDEILQVETHLAKKYGIALKSGDLGEVLMTKDGHPHWDKAIEEAIMEKEEWHPFEFTQPEPTWKPETDDKGNFIWRGTGAWKPTDYVLMVQAVDEFLGKIKEEGAIYDLQTAPYEEYESFAKTQDIPDWVPVAGLHRGLGRGDGTVVSWIGKDGAQYSISETDHSQIVKPTGEVYPAMATSEGMGPERVEYQVWDHERGTFEHFEGTISSIGQTSKRRGKRMILSERLALKIQKSSSNGGTRLSGTNP
jgi:hypothetical protein